MTTLRQSSPIGGGGPRSGRGGQPQTPSARKAPFVAARSLAAPPSPSGEDCSALYVGEVIHRRVHGIDHTLRYRLYMLLLDIDAAEARIRPLRWLTNGRFGLMSYSPRDHGDRSATPLRSQIEGHLHAAGIDLNGGRIQLLTMPRILGYGFNPLSVYFCRYADGTLAALLYEVTNTFHERHSYLVALPSPPPSGEGDRAAVEGASHTLVRQTTEKTFFVSPFMDMDLTYDFTVRPPGEAVSVVVAVRKGDQPILTASFAGQRRPLTDAELFRAWITHPLLTFKVMWGIHWEAAKGMLKGAKYRERDKPPAHPVTVGASR